MAKNKLTVKQQLFIREYLSCWNATEAARRAGYSPKTARAIGPENLNKPVIRTEIDREIESRKATIDEIWLRLAAQARSDVGDFVDDFGNIKLDEVRQAGKTFLIKKLKQHTTRISKKDGEDLEYHDIELELYDAQAATLQLAKLLNMYPAAKLEVYDFRKDAVEAGVDPEFLVTTFERALLTGSPNGKIGAGVTDDPGDTAA